MSGIFAVRGLKAAALSAAVAGGMLFFADVSPASAQGFGYFGYQPFEYRQGMSAGEVRRSLVDQGYRLTGPLMRNGRIYLADVIDQRGRSLRVIVDPDEGRVVQRFVNADPGISARGVERERSAPARAEPAQPSVREPAPRAKRVAPKPSVAAISPTPRAKVQSTRKPQPEPQPTRQSVDSPQAAPAVEAPRPSAPPVVATPSAPRPSVADKPGFVNGVPINPLE